MVARVARDVAAEAYRRLRDLEQRADKSDPFRPGAPNRVRHPHPHPHAGDDARIH